jgi:hypothetical protein
MGLDMEANLKAKLLQAVDNFEDVVRDIITWQTGREDALNNIKIQVNPAHVVVEYTDSRGRPHVLYKKLNRRFFNI